MKFYDDDMDELFRKAGRDYPLKTEPKNWDAVRGALHPEDGAAEATHKRVGWRRLLPLLFLLLIPAVYVFIDKENINRESSALTGNADDKNTGNTKQSVKAVEQPVTNKETVNTNNTVDRTNKLSDREVSRLSYVPPSKQTLRNIAKVEEKSVNVKGGLSDPPQAGLSGIDRVTATEEERERERVRVSERVNYIHDNEPALWNNLPSLNTGFNSGNEPSDVISVKTPGSLNQSTGLTSVPNSDKKNKNRKGPYFGVIASPDISTIKGQKIKGIGYSAGAIVGYTINNHWQVEGGVLWSSKKYYTDGKYFDKKGPGIPSNVNVLWLNGGCEMMEFPVVARYNFSQKRNTFFGSAGLTSYLMKKEDYNYKAMAGPGSYAYDGYREYDRSGDHLFANLQLSAGYNFSLSSKLNIRIEPYLKAPLKKIGIGKMPITSTGLYLAITRDLR